MIYHGKYEVNPADIVDGAINWKTTGNGAFIIAEYKGKKYFVKRNTMGPRCNSPYPEQQFASKRLEDKQAELRDRMKTLSIDTDHIAVEEENFWDDDNIFVTATRMIPGENKDYDYTVLDKDTFLKLCSDMALLLKKIHDVGVTHGDLKEKNILIRHDGSKLIPYLIDFDSSYPSDYGSRVDGDGKVLLSYPVVFSEGYQSPEIAIYNFEDEGVIDPATITEKTDIFTLALIFHNLWTGSFPAIVDDSCPVGEAVYLDRTIKIDPKFDFTLGNNNFCQFSALLRWMLVKDAEKRPTAQQVIDALTDKIEIDDEYVGTGSGVAKFDLVPHPIHNRVVELLTKDELKKMDVRSFIKITDLGEYKYLVRKKDGTEKKLTIDEVIAEGYGKRKSISIGPLWPDDAKVVEYMPDDVLEAKGIIAIEPIKTEFSTSYRVLYGSGNSYNVGKTWMKKEGIVREKEIVYDTEIQDGDKPWPEDGAAYNLAELQSRNIVKVETVVEDGVHKYKVTFEKDGERSENIVNSFYMRVMGFICKE